MYMEGYLVSWINYTYFKSRISCFYWLSPLKAYAYMWIYCNTLKTILSVYMVVSPSYVLSLVIEGDISCCCIFLWMK